MHPSRRSERPAFNAKPLVPIWLTGLWLIVSVPSVLWALVSLPTSTARVVSEEAVELLGGAPAADQWLVMIGFASCGDVCPAGLSAMKQVVEQRAQQGSSVPGVTFVSTGSEQDAQAAQRLATRVHDDFRGVQVSRDRLAPLSETFGAAAGSPAGPENGHSKAIYLLARAEDSWSLRAVFPSSPPRPERIIETLETMP